MLNVGSRHIWLEKRNSNITTELACIAEVFSDFKLVSQIREEVEKVKQANVLTMVVVYPNTVRQTPAITSTAAMIFLKILLRSAKKIVAISTFINTDVADKGVIKVKLPN